MDETETIRITLPSDALQEMRELNPVALNDPELARFYAGLGFIAAKQTSSAGVEVPEGAQTRETSESDSEADDG